MLLSDFDFDLPQELIAQFPLQKRSDSRLLRLDKKTGEISHHQFKELPNLLDSQDLLVMNNTKVIPARLYANKPTGGKVEIFIERMLGDNKCLTQTKASKSLKTGEKLLLDSNNWFEIAGRQDNLFELVLHSSQSMDQILEKFGNIPLPPYIKRQPNSSDQNTYQTVYAKHAGAVAAPTAGLHFDSELMQNLQEKNIKNGFVTLHVGFGTFQPVRVENIEEHKMHHEYIDVPKSTCDQIIETKNNDGKIIAVGTTSIRSLESAGRSGEIKPYQGDTDIFIYPGYNFKIADALITNFHLPKSSLLMLACAFAGHKNIMNAYQEAIKHNYRFYSYGDAMMII